MPLDKKDQKFIQTVVQDSAEITKKEFRREINDVKKIIFNVEEKLESKIEASKNEVITTLSREVTDLADINRAVITKIEEIDYRLRIVERKLGLNVFSQR